MDVLRAVQPEPHLAVLRFRALQGLASEPTDLATRRTAGEAALSAMENHLAGRDWLVGGAYSIADIALYVYTHVAEEGGFALEPHPAVRAWLMRVAAQLGHITIDD